MAGVGEDDLTLSVCGAPLEDSCLVSELSCAELDLTIPLLGGKVHGSLARAGECIHPWRILSDLDMCGDPFGLSLASPNDWYMPTCDTVISTTIY